MVNPPFAQPKLPLQVTLRGDTELLEIFELLLEDEVLAITHPIDTHTPELILLMEDAAWPALSARLQKIADDRGEAFTAMTGLLRDIDWVSKVQKDFPAFRMGRFYIYAAHDAAPIPKNSLPLHIEAASAFGTGEHDTTSGCLLALELESKIRPRPRRVMVRRSWRWRQHGFGRLLVFGRLTMMPGRSEPHARICGSIGCVRCGWGRATAMVTGSYAARSRR
jgi:hypothetical protein